MRTGVWGIVACFAWVAGCGDDDRPALLDPNGQGATGGQTSFGGHSNGGSSGSAGSGAAGTSAGGSGGANAGSGGASAGSGGANAGGNGGSNNGGTGAGATAGAGGTGGTIPNGPFDANAVYRVSQLRGAPTGSTVICPTHAEAPITAAPGVESASRVWIHPDNGNVYYLSGQRIRVVTPNPLTDEGGGTYTYPNLQAAQDDDLELSFTCPQGILVDFVLDQSGNAYLGCESAGTTSWFTESGVAFTACEHDALSHPVAFGTDGSIHCNSRLVTSGSALGISEYWSDSQALAIRANPSGGFRTGNEQVGSSLSVELWQLALSGSNLLNDVNLGIEYSQIDSCALTRSGNLECVAQPTSAPPRILTFGPSGDESPLSDDADTPPCSVTDALLITGP